MKTLGRHQRALQGDSLVARPTQGRKPLCLVQPQVRQEWTASLAHRSHLTRLQAAATDEAASQTAVSEPEPVKPVKQGWWMKNQAPNMKDVGTIQELVDELADAGDKLVIVDFYAPWCNACKALFPKLCQMMHEHVDDVLLLKVSFDTNKEMCKTMGIKVLPYFHFYRGAEGRVAHFSCTVSKIQKMKDAIELYTAAFCSLDEPPGIEEFPEVHAHMAGGVAADGEGGVKELDVHPEDRPTQLRHTDAYWS